MYLHLNQPSNEPVYLKNDGIKIIAQKFLLITKSETTMSA